jgi:hypothetical protein
VRVRAGKGNKDRVTVLAESVKPKLPRHLERLRELYERDRAAGLPQRLQRWGSMSGVLIIGRSQRWKLLLFTEH